MSAAEQSAEIDTRYRVGDVVRYIGSDPRYIGQEGPVTRADNGRRVPLVVMLPAGPPGIGICLNPGDVELVASPGEGDDKRQRGLHGKFRVERIAPSMRGIDHSECRYFVLDPEHDVIALAALARYAQVARSEGYGPLADDLDAWVRDIDRRITSPGQVDS